MNAIRGVEHFHSEIHVDARGELVSFENDDMPFLIERVFFIKVSDRNVVRGGHANSCEELIVSLSGSVLVDADNGEERSRIRLDHHSQSLLVRAGVVIHLREFAPGTVLLVCASARYEDTQHFSMPQPQLMAAHCLT